MYKASSGCSKVGTGKVLGMAVAVVMAVLLAIGMAPGIGPGLEAQAASKPAKVKSVKVKSVKNTSAKITWKKVPSKKVKGYYVSVSTSKSFAKSKTKTYKVAKRTTVSKTVKSLKQNTRYYVKVRAYTTSHGKKVYGKWSGVRSFTTAKTVCTVSYSLPDGSKHSMKVRYGTKISSLKAPAVADHDFVGWYTNKSMTAKASSSATVTKSMTLYPKYVHQTVTVTYAVDGRITTKTLAKGEAVPLEVPEIPVGFVFCGWYLDEGLTEDAIDLIADEDVKLYAKLAEDCAGDGSLQPHSWVVQTKTVHHDAVYRTVHHDAVYDSVVVCSCGVQNPGREHEVNHLMNHDIYNTSVETVVVQEAWDEQVLVSEAYDETVTTGYRCSSCGAIK